MGGTRKAVAAETVPNELQTVVEQIDRYASEKNLEGVLQFYDPQFNHQDGLTRTTLGQVLQSLWQDYSQISYATKIASWQQEGDVWTAETVTTIRGQKTMAGRLMRMESEVRSRQRLQNQKLLGQEILSEKTILTSGERPPTVNFQVPEQVRIGQQFNLDAVVVEPLGNDVLLGVMLEERIQPENYLKSQAIDLELLSAGGLFKIGVAPAMAEPRWISAVLVRGEGMTMITQRLRVVTP